MRALLVHRGEVDEERRKRTAANSDHITGLPEDMDRVYRDVESGKRDSQEGARLVCMQTAIAKVLELTEIERRLARLEERV